MCNRIARTLNSSLATQALALHISKDFKRVLHAGLLCNFRSYEISSQIFGLISFLSMLMILPSTLNLIRHLIRGSNKLLNLNLICETLWTEA